MKMNHGLMKQMTKLGLILMMGVSMNAGAGLFGHTMNWKEEVLLHDGSKIIAERHYNLGGYPAIESQERAALDETVTFNLPGTNKKITWKTDYDQAKPEPNSLNLIRLDVVKGVPYIATYPAGCIAYNKWGRPNPPYVFFKYDGKAWQRIPLEEFPVEFKTINVAISTLADEDKLTNLGFVSAEKIKELNHDARQPEYKTILREPLPKNALCPDWGSPRYTSPKAPLPIPPSNNDNGK